jgi:rapamycin-insensitive companion of mTOR
VLTPVWQIALSVVTDAYGKGPDHAERIRGCARVIQSMLRTWSGASNYHPSVATTQRLFSTIRVDVFLHERHARDSIADRHAAGTVSAVAGEQKRQSLRDGALRHHQEIILDMFFDLLNIKTPGWYKTFIAGRRLTSTLTMPIS